MLCQKCNKNIATVFISTIVNGKNTQMYLCTDCARELHDSMSPDMQIPFPINDILSKLEIDEESISNLISNLTKEESDDYEEDELMHEDEEEIHELQEDDEASDIICSTCNTSFKEYKKTGKLGCSECYKAFEDELDPRIKSIYGFSEHVGKYPKNKAKNNSSIERIRELKEQLNTAIKNEEYEDAAKLRDEILKIEANDI